MWLLTLRQKTAFPLLLYNTTQCACLHPYSWSCENRVEERSVSVQEVDGFTTSANEPLSTFSQSTF